MVYFAAVQKTSFYIPLFYTEHDLHDTCISKNRYNLVVLENCILFSLFLIFYDLWMIHLIAKILLRILTIYKICLKIVHKLWIGYRIRWMHMQIGRGKKGLDNSWQTNGFSLTIGITRPTFLCIEDIIFKMIVVYIYVVSVHWNYLIEVISIGTSQKLVSLWQIKGKRVRKLWICDLCMLNVCFRKYSMTFCLC